MSSGGGGSQPTQQTVSQATIPDYLAPYATTLAGQGQALTDINQNPYQSYGGAQVAGLSPLQQQSQTQLSGMTSSPLLGSAAGVTGNVIQQTPGATSYTPMQQYSSYNPGPLNTYQMNSPGNVGTGSFTDQGVASSYMSPYIQNALGQQNQMAIQNYQASTAPQTQSAATMQGAFGGNRLDLANAQNAKNLNQQLNLNTAQGLNTAYQTGQNAYATDAARQLAAQQSNQQMGFNVGQQNLGAALGVQQLGQQAGQQAAALGLQAQQGTEASRQFGAGLGLQGLQTQLGAANQLAGIGSQDYSQTMGINAAQQQAGATDQATMQNQLNAAYQNYLNQQNYPYKNLAFMSDILHGIPLTQTSSQFYAQPPSAVSQTAGLGLGLGSLLNATGK